MNAMDKSPEFIFVYGTLRRNPASGAHHSLLLDAAYLGSANLQAKLFRVSFYPAIALANDGSTVIGEIYQLKNQQQLRLLDNYEECPQPWTAQQEYRREVVSVTMQENNQILHAWTYIYNHPTENLQQIISGDFYQPA